MRRRDALKTTGLFAGAALLSGRSAAAAVPATTTTTTTSSSSSQTATPVTVPNGGTLPLHDVGGVRVGHLIAEEFEHEFAPGLKALCWGWNQSTPGPVIECVEGDRLRIYVTNRLPEPTTVHWHGIILPCGQDGVSGLTQAPIQPGDTWVYEFDVNDAGTFMYHPHYDEMTQMALGMMGMMVVHEKDNAHPVDRDFSIMLSEWSIKPGARRPDPLEMVDFNVATMNSKAFPGTAPLIVKTGDRVRIRFGNLSAMDNHPVHLHGYNFKIVGTDGGRIPDAAQWPETTVLVPTGSCRVVEFVAEHPGDWAMHCHMTHHIMNQMGHGTPSMVGVDAKAIDARVRRLRKDFMAMGMGGMGGMAEMGMPVPDNSIPMGGGQGPFSYIDMGGMFTVLKVRDEVGDDGSHDEWFAHPEGSGARVATADDLKKDGIRLPESTGR